MKRVLPSRPARRLQPAAGTSAGQPGRRSQRRPPSRRPPKAFVYDEKNELIEFHYGWSAEAAAVPQLVDRFRKEMER